MWDRSALSLRDRCQTTRASGAAGTPRCVSRQPLSAAVHHGAVDLRGRADVPQQRIWRVSGNHPRKHNDVRGRRPAAGRPRQAPDSDQPNDGWPRHLLGARRVHDTERVPTVTRCRKIAAGLPIICRSLAASADSRRLSLRQLRSRPTGPAAIQSLRHLLQSRHGERFGGQRALTLGAGEPSFRAHPGRGKRRGGDAAETRFHWRGGRREGS